MRVLSQEIAKNATEAAGGTAEAFDQLRRSRDEFQQFWTSVTEGNPETGLPASELAQQSGVQQHWNSVRENADSILSTREAVLGLHEVARTLNETIPQLQVEYDDIVQILLDNDAPAEQISLAQRQSLLAERIVRSVNNVLSVTKTPLSPPTVSAVTPACSGGFWTVSSTATRPWVSAG